MARPLGRGEKPLNWVGSSKKDFLTFPARVKGEMGTALGVAQFGGKHPSAKPWKGHGPGVFEVVEDHIGDTYRAVYTVKLAGIIYVLHCFQKKSKKGKETPKQTINLIKQRLKTATEAHERQKRSVSHEQKN